MEEFGLHANKYYRVEHSFFKSKLDNQILQTLWNEYWIQTLSASPLITVSLRLTVEQRVPERVDLRHREEDAAGDIGEGEAGKRGEEGVEEENLNQAVEVSSKTALELNHGMMVEFLKKFMFTS